MNERTDLVSKSELSKIAQIVLAEAANASGNKRAFLIFLDGNLGAGKTTFVQAFGKLLGIKEKILSPTFVFIHEHITSKKNFPYTKLIHIDAYRLETKRDFDSLRIKDYLKNPENILCVEWADKIRKWLPKPDVEIQFEHHSESKREVKIVRDSKFIIPNS